MELDFTSMDEIINHKKANNNLKMFYGLATSLPRSINDYFANYIYSILAYALKQSSSLFGRLYLS